MARKAQRLSPAQIRDRKAKRLAIGLGIVFVAVLAFEAPTFLHLFGGGSSATTASPPASTAGATSATSVAAGAVPAPSAGPAAPSQLTSFGEFALSNPFHQVVVAAATTTPTAAKSGTGSATKAATSPKKTSGAKTAAAKAGAGKAGRGASGKRKPGAKGAATPHAIPLTTHASTALPQAALIVANGKPEVVSLGQSFPRGQPLFKLVSLARRGQSMSISVLGGSFTSGVPALVVRRGRTVTLADESSGQRYALRLVRLKAVAATTSAGGGSHGG